jgi:hypothetical protein
VGRKRKDINRLRGRARETMGEKEEFTEREGRKMRNNGRKERGDRGVKKKSRERMGGDKEFAEA